MPSIPQLTQDFFPSYEQIRALPVQSAELFLQAAVLKTLLSEPAFSRVVSNPQEKLLQILFKLFDDPGCPVRPQVDNTDSTYHTPITVKRDKILVDLRRALEGLVDDPASNAASKFQAPAPAVQTPLKDQVEYIQLLSSSKDEIVRLRDDHNVEQMNPDELLNHDDTNPFSRLVQKLVVTLSAKSIELPAALERQIEELSPERVLKTLNKLIDFHGADKESDGTPLVTVIRTITREICDKLPLQEGKGEHRSPRSDLPKLKLALILLPFLLQKSGADTTLTSDPELKDIITQVLEAKTKTAEASMRLRNDQRPASERVSMNSSSLQQDQGQFFQEAVRNRLATQLEVNKSEIHLGDLILKPSPNFQAISSQSVSGPMTNVNALFFPGLGHFVLKFAEFGNSKDLYTRGKQRAQSKQPNYLDITIESEVLGLVRLLGLAEGDSIAIVMILESESSLTRAKELSPELSKMLKSCGFHSLSLQFKLNHS